MVHATNGYFIKSHLSLLVKSARVRDLILCGNLRPRVFTRNPKFLTLFGLIVVPDVCTYYHIPTCWLSTPIRDKYGPEEVVVDLLLGATVGEGHLGL